MLQPFIVQEVGKGGVRAKVQPYSADKALLILFTGTFIGILCARSLHFQFYCWYFQMLPFLLWQVGSAFAWDTLRLLSRIL